MHDEGTLDLSALSALGVVASAHLDNTTTQAYDRPEQHIAVVVGFSDVSALGLITRAQPHCEAASRTVLEILLMHALAVAVADALTTVPRRKREVLSDYLARILADPVLAAHPVAAHLGQLDLAVFILMVFLGPRGSGDPPDALYQELLELAQRFTQTTPADLLLERVAQLALAYGCMWKRASHCAASDPRWNYFWPGTLQELVDLAFVYVNGAIRVLEDTIYHFQTVSPDLFTISSYAQYAVGILVGQAPRVPGAKFMLFHALLNWDPARGSLYGFLLMAIIGVPRMPERLQLNQFNQGLLYPQLKADGLLDGGDVAFRHCKACEDEVEFNHMPCRKCDSKYTALGIEIYAKALPIVPWVYVGLPFRHCNGLRDADRYYETGIDYCPYCERSASACAPKTTTLLVRI